MGGEAFSAQKWVGAGGEDCPVDWVERATPLPPSGMGGSKHKFNYQGLPLTTSNKSALLKIYTGKFMFLLAFFFGK